MDTSGQQHRCGGRPIRRPRTVVALATVMAAITMTGPAAAQTPASARAAAPSIQSLPSDPATVIAVVGNSPVLLGDLMPKVDSRIREVVSQTGHELPPEQLASARVAVLRQFLMRTIQNKVMREAFVLDQVATQSADKRSEAMLKMNNKARQYFFEKQIPDLLKRHNASDLRELDDKLKSEGSSLLMLQNEFADEMLGQLYINNHLDRKPDVPLGQIYQYYDEHRQDYFQASRARWEQLSVMFEVVPDRSAAQQLISEMGREAFYGGSMQAVARSKSQEPFASDGGVHDWTDQGSLRSKPLDQMIFSLPLNQMSDIIADDDGLHIVRVLERKEAGVQPLAEVQDAITKTLQAEIVQKTQQRLTEALSDTVSVWSLFPDDYPGAKPLPGSAAIADGPPPTIRR